MVENLVKFMKQDTLTRILIALAVFVGFLLNETKYLLVGIILAIIMLSREIYLNRQK